MRRYATGLSLVTLVLGGCATSGPPEFGYLAPTGLPPRARTASIQQQPRLVFGNLVDRLQQDGFKVTHLDEQAGEAGLDTRAIRSPTSMRLDRHLPARQSRAVPAASATARFDRRGGECRSS